jgi:hypothetical protein
LVAACSSGRDVTAKTSGDADAPRETHDQKSGATVWSPEKPLLFAHERNELTPNMRDAPSGRGAPSLRDYVSIVGVRVDRVGKLDYLLIAHIWSTFDQRLDPGQPPIDSVELRADGRSIFLDPSGGTPADFGIMQPVGTPKGRTVKSLVYRTDLATLGRVAAAQDLAVLVHSRNAEPHYKLWDDQRQALNNLVRSFGAEP